MANPFESELSPLDAATERRLSAEEGVKFSVGGSPQRDDERQQQQQSRTEDKISLDTIARVLLHENYLLTALELHTELIESGRELKRLNDFFSNPQNFETNQVTGGLSESSLLRASSVQTFDSFDAQSHGSDEHSGNDKVAVLEYELRNAKSQIRNLRNQLTTDSEQSGVVLAAASTETVTEPAVSNSQSFADQRTTCQVPVLPHEQRAINFLVHEYLLRHEYKLTSVTFSDEAADQDFEDWDEVGLNVPRPADLLALYREFCHSTPGYVNTRDVGSTADLDAETNPFMELESSSELLNRLNSENSELLDRNGYLSDKIERLTSEIEKLRKQVSEISKERQPSPIKVPEEQTPVRIIKALRPLNNVPNIERNRTLPPAFANSVNAELNKGVPSNYDDWLKELDSVPKSMAETVDQLTVCLPKIIPHVLINRRHELIKMILISVLLHPSCAETEQLLNDLFNLIKKPDNKQRSMIVGGCTVFAKYAGPTRIEAELLPLCWEQIGHKHVERRQLVAETCGALACHIPPSLISSLVLSMLQQMLLEDKSELVRQAVVSSLSSVCLYIEDRDKFSQMTDLVQRALLDANESVVASAQTLLLPSFAVWADQMGKLQLGVVSLFVRKLAQVIQTSGATQSANEMLICTYLGCLRNLSGILFWSVLRSAPFVKQNGPDAATNDSILHDDRFPESSGPLCSPWLYSQASDNFNGWVKSYDTLTSTEWYATWDALEFVLKDMLPQLVSVLERVEVSLTKALPLLVDYFQTLCQLFGRGFTVSKIQSLFTPSLTVPPEGTEPGAAAQFAVCHATLPVYCAGVLSAFQEDQDWHELRKFLRWKVVAIAESNAPTHAVTVTFCQLCKCWKRHSDLVSLIWDFIPHKSTAVRRMSAQILSELGPLVSEQLIETKIIPGLVTLAADNQPCVRKETLSGLVSVLQMEDDNQNLKDKVTLQLSSLFDDSDVGVTSHLVRTLAQAVPNLHVEFRDEFVLVRLLSLAERTADVTDAQNRKQQSEALFEVYSALSCCFLSPNVIAELFLPGLRHLLKGLDPEHIKIASSILRDAENKLGAANLVRSQETTKISTLVGEANVEDMRNKMFSTIRDIKGKMDQHRADVPSIFKKK